MASAQCVRLPFAAGISATPAGLNKRVDESGVIGANPNNERTHQGKMCCGRTPMETLLDGKRILAEKI
ncbi:hypothetical protein FMJ22_24525 [Klebsiella michiganensis]|nr:hypothetical protein [Klebsiella michiganensis]